MTKEDYVSLEVAKLLKNKGFNEQCRYTYCGESEEDVGVSNNKNSSYPKGVYYMPTLYQAQKWLIEKHKIVVRAFISDPFPEQLRFMYLIQSPNFGIDNYSTTINTEDFPSYEEALNEGILEALKLI